MTRPPGPTACAVPGVCGPERFPMDMGRGTAPARGGRGEWSAASDHWW